MGSSTSTHARSWIVGPAQPDSADACRLLAAYIAELQERLAGGHGVRPEWNAAQYGGSRGRILLGYVDGAAVGCAGLREHAHDTGELKHFYVAPEARGRGVGASLVRGIEDEARDAGFRRVVLDTADKLEEAARLYERSGYERTSPFNDNPHASRWYEKTLPLDDRALAGAFAHASLPAAEWTHTTHLRVAFLHLARFTDDVDLAHLHMRVGIIRLNATHGLVETAERGYHETLTRAWLALVRAARATRDAGVMDSRDFVGRHATELDKAAPLRHYTRELLLSVRARTRFVEPDLEPLPQ